VGGAIDEAYTEAGNARTRWFAAVIKRPRKGSAGDAIVAIPLWLFTDLLRELQSTQQAIGGR